MHARRTIICRDHPKAFRGGTCCGSPRRGIRRHHRVACPLAGERCSERSLSTAPWHHQLAGNGNHPIPLPPQLGCCNVAPLRPHFMQRADRRSMSLDVSAPHRMINGVTAIGAICRHAWFWQCTHSHGALRRICSSVGGGGNGWRGMPIGYAVRCHREAARGGCAFRGRRPRCGA
jgi:hypothetical protein